jgi:hypothetical protein
MNVYHCSITIALDIGPVMAGHVIADNAKEAKARFESYFFNYKTEGLPASSIAHIEKAKADARESWFTVKATKSTVSPANAINC